MMKQYILTVIILSGSRCAAEEELNLKSSLETKHSNIHLQRIINKSNRNAFMAIERAHIMGELAQNEEINMAGHIMPGETFELKGPQHNSYGIMIPVWQKTFRGNTVNIISLAGHPGRIYYLYTIKDALWAIKAPEKNGDLKGVILLQPSKENRKIQIILHNNDVIEAQVLDQNGKPNGERTKLAFSTTDATTNTTTTDVTTSKDPRTKKLVQRYAR